MDHSEEAPRSASRSGRILVGGVVAGVVAVVTYFAFGMPGMDHSTSTGSDPAGSMSHESMSFMRLEPAAFAARLTEPSAFVVNVHTPFEGAIDGTDVFIPFDEIVGDQRLPADRDTKMLLYCESGRMSEIAAQALIAAGYTDVVDLEGGMQAWERSGMAIEDRPSASN